MEPLADSLSGVRVLHVEDDPDHRVLVRAVLERLGAEVEEAADGVEGWTLATGGDHDVVLTDFGMPRLNGLDMTRRLREAGFRRPIVAMSIWALEFSAAELREAGFDAWLGKPFETRALRDTLARVTGLQRRAIPVEVPDAVGWHATL